MTRPVPAPSTVEAAFAEAGTNVKAAQLLGLVPRTLERQIARRRDLWEAARRGRAAYREANRPACGTYTAYQAGCRCTPCRAANAAYHRKEPRVLDIDDPFGAVYVAGTHDLAVALPLARAELIDRGVFHDDEPGLEEFLKNYRLDWYRKVPCRPDHPEGWAWQLWPAKPGTLGAFRVVTFG